MVLIASLLLTASAATAAEPGLHEVCGDFRAWYETHASADEPTAEYHADLIDRGVAPVEVERRLAMVRESASACPAAAGAAFDRIYRNPTPRFSTAPNALLAESVEGIARASAETARVKIHAVHQGWQEFDLVKEQWDLIVLSYAWVPIDDPAFVQRLCDALRPGGYVVFEHLLVESRAGLGMPESQQLLRVFDGLRILRYEEVEQVSDWNNEKSPVVRFVARK